MTPLAYLLAKADLSILPILLGSALFFCQTFFLVHHTSHSRFLPLFLSLFFSLSFGIAAVFAEHWLNRLAGLLQLRINRILSLFLLFFILLLGYLLLTSLLISSPMALVLARSSYSPESINLYVLQNSNCALALALASLLRRLFPLLRKADRGVIFQLHPSKH